MIRQIKNLFSVSSRRTELSGSIVFNGLTKLFHKPHPLFLLLHLLLLLHFLSCNSATQPPPDTGAITITVEDASCIEAWINLKAENITLPAAVTLKQSENNGEEKVRQVINLTTADTLLFVDSLLPKRSYKFKAEWINNSGKLKTAEAAVVTMDTTSHNFTWQEFTIGDWQSYLTDVWGTDENNVYAVGSIRLNGEQYSVLHYDGIQWSVVTDTVGGYAIFGFNANDIWVVGGGVFHFDGVKWKQIDSYFKSDHIYILDSILFDNSPYSSLWGTSSNNMYFGNARGKIIHWDGKKGRVVYSGAEIPLTDIHGCDPNYIIAVGSALTSPSLTLKNEDHLWQRIEAIDINRLFYSVFCRSSNNIYIVGEEVINYKNQKVIKLALSNSVMNKVRGASNGVEIAVVGHFSELWYFNGITWRLNKFTLTDYSPLNSVWLTNTKVFAVGSFGNNAKIIIGNKL